jgi:hypothetical protein
MQHPEGPSDLRYQRAYLIDLDGTFFLFGTQHPAPGAVETVRRMLADGVAVWFVTRRTRLDPVLGEAATVGILQHHGLDVCGILWSVGSPRVLVDDAAPMAIEVARNAGFSDKVLFPWNGCAPDVTDGPDDPGNGGVETATRGTCARRGPDTVTSHESRR